MARINQRGRISTVILFSLILLAGIVMIMAYIIGDKQTDVVEQSNVASREKLDSDASVQTPENWQSYTNPNNGYMFAYPVEWGTVVQEEPSTDTFAYTFTTQEDVMVTQTPDALEPIPFNGNYKIFSSFKSEDQVVKFCTLTNCQGAYEMPSAEVRLGINEYSHRYAEFFYERDGQLFAVIVVNNEYGNYSGINLLIRVDDSIEKPNESLDQKVNIARGDRTAFFNEFRAFTDYLP